MEAHSLATWKCVALSISQHLDTLLYNTLSFSSRFGILTAERLDQEGYRSSSRTCDSAAMTDPSCACSKSESLAVLPLAGLLFALKNFIMILAYC